MYFKIPDSGTTRHQTPFKQSTQNKIWELIIIFHFSQNCDEISFNLSVAQFPIVAVLFGELQRIRCTEENPTRLVGCTDDVFPSRTLDYVIIISFVSHACHSFHVYRLQSFVDRNGNQFFFYGDRKKQQDVRKFGYFLIGWCVVVHLDQLICTYWKHNITHISVFITEKKHENTSQNIGNIAMILGITTCSTTNMAWLEFSGWKNQISMTKPIKWCRIFSQFRLNSEQVTVNYCNLISRYIDYNG